MDNSNRPSIRAYIGASGSGKGVSVREHLRQVRFARLLIWDPLGEYGFACKLVTTDLAAVARACKQESFSVAYNPGPDTSKFPERFALLCRIAWAAGNCGFLVEELADVTSASHAPIQWSRLTRQGRHRGIQIIACTQRPAIVDKNFLGSCTYIRIFCLRYPEDRKSVAGLLDVTHQEVQELQTIERAGGTEINYIERDFRGGKATKGVMRISRKKRPT